MNRGSNKGTVLHGRPLLFYPTFSYSFTVKENPIPVTVLVGGYFSVPIFESPGPKSIGPASAH